MMYSPYYRRNFIALLSDYVSWALALTFASTTTVLPALVGHLTDSEVAVGLVSSVSIGAWLLPQLIYANLLSSKRRKKNYVVLGAVIGRPLYLIYAIALGLGLYRNPLLALLLLYGVQITLFASEAFASVGWYDVMAKAIPSVRRGRLVGGAQLIKGVLSIGAGGLIASLLSADGPPFPQNYAVILALASLCFLVSLLAWCFVVEPDEPVEEIRPGWREYVPRLRDTLRQDRIFGRLILVRLLAGCDGLALGFYVLFATRELGLPAKSLGLFTVAQTTGGILASVGLGALAERAGSHRVVQVATAIGLTAPLICLTLCLADAPPGALTGATIVWVFMALGVTASSRMLGFSNFALELAPAGLRPTYIGLLNTLSGALIIVPILGGWLLRTTSYDVLFVVTALLLVVAHWASLRLPAGRATATQLQAEPAT
jgi:hypothetical protein